MTSPMPIVCRRCGTENIAGDQFCGSCGAFLEWEGEAPEPAEGVAPPSLATGPEPVAGGEPHAATPAPPPVSAPDPGLVRCPACGIANPGTRTFCQSCGTKLPAEARVDHAAATTAWVASGAAAPRPDPGTPAPVPTGKPAPAKPAPKDTPRSSGGIPGWLLGVAGLGLAVGVGVVVVSSLMAPPEVPSGATSVPGTPRPVTPAASSSADASASVPPGAEPTASPAQGAKLPVVGATVSSVVGGRAKFGADKAVDGDPATAWQEGAADEAGQWIELSFAPARVDRLVVWNGYQESEAAFLANRRLRAVTITFDTGQFLDVELADTMEPITVEIEGVTAASNVRIEIRTTWDPEKTSYPGSPFDDCALSEIEIIGAPAS